jgi:hypothetical protein
MVRRDDVERLAYELWEREGRPNGRDQTHYYEAERLLWTKEGMISEDNRPASRKGDGGKRPRRRGSSRTTPK